MMKGTMTNFDICKAATEFILKRGYTPSFSEEELKVECDVDGINFSVYGLDDEHYFGYSCHFDYGRALSADEKDEVTKRFKNEEPVIFENLHFVEDGVLLSCALPTEFFTEDDVKEVITALHRTGGILKYLKSNSERNKISSTIAIKEISARGFDTLVKNGYSPRHINDDHIEFDCNIGGVKFSFYPFDEKVFKYIAEFDLKEKLTPDEIERIGHVHVESADEDYVVFECFNKIGDIVYLSNLFNVDTYPESFVEEAIKVLTSSEWIAMLKSKSYAWEEPNIDPALKEIVKQSYNVLIDRGYSPEYTRGRDGFDCIIKGIRFSLSCVQGNDTVGLGYCSEFRFEKKISKSEKARLEGMHSERKPSEVVSETLDIDRKYAWLYGELATTLSPEDIAKFIIETLTSEDDVIAELRKKSKIMHRGGKLI